MAAQNAVGQWVWYTPQVEEVDGVPSHHPVKNTCKACSNLKVKCEGHSGRTQPCTRCRWFPEPCTFNRSLRPARRGPNLAVVAPAAAPAAAAIAATVPPAQAHVAAPLPGAGPVADPGLVLSAPGWPAATSTAAANASGPLPGAAGPVRVIPAPPSRVKAKVAPVAGALPATDLGLVAGPQPPTAGFIAAGFVPAGATLPAGSLSLAVPSAPPADTLSAPGTLPDPGTFLPPAPAPPAGLCPFHAGLLDGPLEFLRLLNGPGAAATPWTADALLKSNAAALEACGLVLGCPAGCAAGDRAALAGVGDVLLGACRVYERAAGALPFLPPGDGLALRGRLRRSVRECGVLGDQLAAAVAHCDPDRVVEVWERIEDARGALGLMPGGEEEEEEVDVGVGGMDGSHMGGDVDGGDQWLG